jgi:hypothetical protein
VMPLQGISDTQLADELPAGSQVLDAPIVEERPSGAGQVTRDSRSVRTGSAYAFGRSSRDQAGSWFRRGQDILLWSKQASWVNAAPASS